MSDPIVPQASDPGNTPDASRSRFRGYSNPHYTQIPDVLFDEQLPDLSGAELKVLLYIMRRTFGFKKDSDNISLSQITHGIKTKEGKQLDRGTGLHKSTAVVATNALVEKGYIIKTARASVERGDEPNNYRLNLGSHSSASSHAPVSDYPTPPRVVKSDTQETVKQETEHVHEQQHMHDKSRCEALDSVVVALANLGVTSRTAWDLAQKHPEGHIRAQIDMLPYRQASDPAAVLVKAIREEWTAPTGYETPEQREGRASRKAHEQAERASAVEESKQHRESWPQRMIEQHEIDQATLELWQRAQRQLPRLVGPGAYQRALAEALLEPPGKAYVTVLVPSYAHKLQLKPEHHEALERVLHGELGRKVRVDVRYAP